jgi:hypothetical protein
MAAGTQFDVFTADMLAGVHDFTAGTGHEFKLLLTNTAPDAGADEVIGDITEIAAGNGYTAGGIPVDVSISSLAAVSRVIVSDETINASGAVGPFGYAVLYNNTVATPNKPLICFWTLDAPITMANGDTFTVDFNPTNGALSVGPAP